MTICISILYLSKQHQYITDSNLGYVVNRCPVGTDEKLAQLCTCASQSEGEVTFIINNFILMMRKET